MELFRPELIARTQEINEVRKVACDVDRPPATSPGRNICSASKPRVVLYHKPQVPKPAQARAVRLHTSTSDAGPMSHTEEIRFVTYQGTSPLPQLYWKLPWSGPLLVLSLFDGVGALLLSLLALGATFAALAWKTDSDAVYITSKTFRHLRHMGDVRSFDPACVEDLLMSRKFTAVLVAGGSPCQDVSLLKANRPGLQSARSLLFNSVPEFADQCRQVVKDLGLRIPVLTMLENVASRLL